MPEPPEGGSGGDISNPIGGGYVVIWHPSFGFKWIPVGGLPPLSGEGRGPIRGCRPRQSPKAARVTEERRSGEQGRMVPVRARYPVRDRPRYHTHLHVKRNRLLFYGSLFVAGFLLTVWLSGKR